MSTLGVSIVALVAVVVAVVVLFNLWQSRDSRRRETHGQAGNAGHGGGRFDMAAGSGQRNRSSPDSRSAGTGRRWQPGVDQNAWARQRREPTLTADDGAASAARPAHRSEADGFDDFSHGSTQYADDFGDHQGHDPDRPFPMSADDEPGTMAGDDDLGPPEFEAPRLEPMPFEPPMPGTPRIESPRFEPSGPELARREAAPRTPVPSAKPAVAATAAPPARQALPPFDDTRPLAGEPDPAARPAIARPAAADAAGDLPPVLGHPDGAPRTDAPVYLPADVDLVVTLIPRSPVNAERLIALTSSLRHVGSKSIRIEIDSGQGRWIALQSGTMVGCLRCSVLLANRQGPLNAVELSDFSAAMESLAGQIGARFTAPDMNQVLRQARELDAVAAKLDTQVDLGVEAAEPIAPARLAAIARKLDLFDRGGGRYACLGEGGELIYTLTAGETTDMLAFVLDVPRTAHAHDPWRSMVTCASSCAQLVGGRVVDAAGRGMSVGMIDAVGQQIDRRYRELADAGLKAGAPATLRVFN